MLETEMGHRIMINNGRVKLTIIPPETIMMIKETKKFPSSMKSYRRLIKAMLDNR